MANKYFLPLAEIRKLAEGSFEQTVSLLFQEVEKSSEQIFGESVACDLIGTFPNSALVLGENGAVARIQWKRDESGQPQITSHEMVRVPRYEANDVPQYVQTEVRKAVQAWKEGRVDEAHRIISEVAPYVSEAPPKDDAKVVESLGVELRASRPWRVLLRARAAHIRPLIGESEIRRIEGKRQDPKYTLLYNGSMTESELLGYRDLVEGDFTYLTTRVGTLRKLVESSYESVRSVVLSDELKEEEAIKLFVSFSEDLIPDIRRLQKIVSEATNQISKLDSLGKLYDTVVEHVTDYEVAGRFVEAMSGRLLEAMK